MLIYYLQFRKTENFICLQQRPSCKLLVWITFFGKDASAIASDIMRYNGRGIGFEGATGFHIMN